LDAWHGILVTRNPFYVHYGVFRNPGMGFTHTHTHPSLDFEESCPNSLSLLGVDSKASSLCRLVKKKKSVKNKRCTTKKGSEMNVNVIRTGRII
jgi:hypothetical protein